MYAPVAQWIEHRSSEPRVVGSKYQYQAGYTIVILGGDMGQKLQQGDRFPSLTLKLVGGETVTIPDQMSSRYVALLFYRGHW